MHSENAGPGGVAAPWAGARAWIGWWALPGGLEGCVSSMGDPALSGSLFRRLQRCETRRRSVDKVEAFQTYMLYCTAHRGQGSHSFTHFPTAKSLYINYMESATFGQKKIYFSNTSSLPVWWSVSISTILHVQSFKTAGMVKEKKTAQVSYLKSGINCLRS